MESRKCSPKESGFLIIILLAFGLLAFPNVAAAAMEFNVTVDVTITTLVEITVSPASLNWSNAAPGYAGGQKNLSVQNTGSTNITSLYAFITTLANETSRPYGSSDPGSYSAGGVVVYRNESNNKYYWAGRLEWNWTEIISNTDKSAIGSTSRVAEGFFRNASYSYYWAVGNGTNLTGGSTVGKCNSTGTLFAIEDDIDTGVVGTRTPDATSITRDGNDQTYSYFSVNRGTNFLNGACIAVSVNCDKIFAYKFDRRSGVLNATTCVNALDINSAQMAPGDIEAIVADVWIPKGIPAGNMKTATWTFVAS